MRTGNYYEILGVSQNASQDEIRKAYAALIKRYTNEHYPDEFRQIREAYDTLRDERLRRLYDQDLNTQSRYNLRIADAEREYNNGNYYLALQILEQLQHEYPGDWRIHNEIQKCRSHIDSFYQYSRPTNYNQYNYQEASANKNDSSWDWVGGVCCCIIVIIIILNMS
jgi:curved DNA-binding protein CbpA